jgi:hypothetical protein
MPVGIAQRLAERRQAGEDLIGNMVPVWGSPSTSGLSPRFTSTGVIRLSIEQSGHITLGLDPALGTSAADRARSAP